MLSILKWIFGTAQDRQVRKFRKIVEKINEWEQKFLPLTDDELRAKTQEFRDRYASGQSLEELLPEAYAVIKVACRRLCGTEVHVSGYDQKWDMIPYDVQLIGAISMNNGTISEMQTGEGKTLTAVLPLYLNALTGKPVHLVTVNDYLADRDCQWAGSVLRWMGLTTGVLTNATPQETRKEVYGRDVVYGTASEFGFDYLRDNSMAMHKNEQVQRGYFFAIIDEVDSILIDEARTPLIISGPSPVSRQMYDQLEAGVADLVRKQRDQCSALATDARKGLEEVQKAREENRFDKKMAEKERQALHTLWIVNKGTPRNKILKRLKEDPDIRAGIDEWDLYYYTDQNKPEKAEAISQLYITVDEKASEYELTDKGIHTWEEASRGELSSSDFVMLDLGYEYHKIDQDHSLDEETKMRKRMEVQEEDTRRKERAHNLRQLLRAHLLMERDVDYMVQDGKVIIVDEHTGRPQPGRRFSDGLHQAIEAKEGVPIQRETQTYATITLQNYFRMYEKISGMTGTATTEAGEFKEIYKLDVLEIPTHKNCVRNDFNDEIYMTEREKYAAILKDVADIHGQGRPILIGTESVEVSEKLSRVFKQNNLEHTVLNAKYHEREAEIIAMAGQRGAITIATNMAGRGTDIKLGEGVAGIGGLYVMGTTRHQSRRIDRQLRGRCARQGDPGTSKFYVSFEDPLMRLFASPTITGILQKLRPPEGEPISARMLDKSIQTAQKRVEQRNYTIRKHTLEYDDVMNKQRQAIYEFRNEVLHSDDIETIAVDLLHTVCLLNAETYFKNRSEEGGWDAEGYRLWLLEHFPVSFEVGEFDDEYTDIEVLAQRAADKIIHAFKDKIRREDQKIPPAPEGSAPRPNIAMRAIRDLMIRKIDMRWQEHLLTMDHLRADVSLRTVGQRDPLMEFKHEAFQMFHDLSVNLRTDIAHDLFRFEIVSPQQATLQQLLSKMRMETNRSFLTELEGLQPVNFPQSRPPIQPIDTAELAEEKLQPVMVEPRVGRNDLCPCGSGLKYKKCHGKGQEGPE
ncbi:MAG: preprotein translocase subunit SecA [Chlamydiales bacterium]|nr:preprotein translocase subunit SecA [Chlamydiales bacterium]